MHASVTYFCWLCDRPACCDTYRDTHYETGAVIRFCSCAHLAEYRELKNL